MNLNKSCVIAISNMKGGVGKTTLTINLAYQFAKYFNVCIVDIDPQIHAIKFFINEKEILNSKVLLKDVLEFIIEKGSIEDETKIKSFIEESIYEYSEDEKTKISFILSSPLLDSIDDKVKSEIAVPYLFKKLFLFLKEKFQIILVDCPPSVSRALVQSVYCGCDYILIPTDPSYFSVESIDNVINTYIKLKSNYNNNLNILGIVLTMYKKNHQLSKLFLENLQEIYPEFFIKEIQIPALTDFQKSIILKKDVCSFKKNSQACVSIKKLSKYILQKIQQ